MEYLRHSESDKDEVFHNLLRPTAEEHFSDLGAYNGDTIRELLHYTDGKFASVTALEPDRRSFRKLNEWASANITGDVTLVQAGAWNEDTVKCFTDQAGRQSRVAGQGKETQMRALDSVLSGRPCTYLKMDVEGAEREAIAGAEKTIRQYAPKLNIAPITAVRISFSCRCSSMRCSRATGCICVTILMFRRGIRICTQYKKQWKSRSGRCIIKIDYGRV